MCWCQIIQWNYEMCTLSPFYIIYKRIQCRLSAGVIFLIKHKESERYNTPALNMQSHTIECDTEKLYFICFTKGWNLIPIFTTTSAGATLITHKLKARAPINFILNVLQSSHILNGDTTTLSNSVILHTNGYTKARRKCWPVRTPSQNRIVVY